MKKKNLSKLFHPKLVHKNSISNHVRANAPLQKDPFSYLIARDLVQKKNFYKNLAEVYKLRYFDTIPSALSGEKLVAQMCPPAKLLDADIYLLEQNHELIVIASTPYITKEKIDDIVRYTGYSEYELVISPPSEIAKAQSHAFYKYLGIPTEDRVTTLHPEYSSKRYQTFLIPKIFPISTVILYFISLLVIPKAMLTGTFYFLNILYLIINPFKLYTFVWSIKSQKAQIKIKKSEIDSLLEDDLPVYTILIPLRNEKGVITQLVKHMLSINYPKDKLDIKFIVDAGDEITENALLKSGIGVTSVDADVAQISTEIIKVPEGSVATKPRACNYALQFAKGKYTVIYDAEDLPDLDQLKKVVIAYKKSSVNTVCIQAKLNYYNDRYNILTRLFALEYSFWFDFHLLGLSSIRSPIPLGGTSNHFVTDALRQIGSWDPFNVTEDADLGLRLYRSGYETKILDSYTLEEANSKIMNWIRQRTRWQKGFLITFLVHIHDLPKLKKDVGIRGLMYVLLNFGTSFFLPLFNLLLWLVFALALFIPPELLLNTNQAIMILAGANLIIGNAIYIGTHALAAWKINRKHLIPYTLLLPLYWILISIATMRAMIQFIRKPFHWEKTEHGLALVGNKAHSEV